MEKKTHSLKFLKKRKFIMVLPLLVLPFATMIFWSLGGGKRSGIPGSEKNNGLNPELPGANLKDDKALSKLGFYEQSERDSAKLKELMKTDPYYRNDIAAREMNKPLFEEPGAGNLQGYKDPNEEKVYRKLAELNRQLNQTAVDGKQDKYIKPEPASTTQAINSEDIDRLEYMMQSMKENGGEDPEIHRLNGTLEKILDIQHPERVKERLAKQPEAKTSRQTVFKATAAEKGFAVSLLRSDTSRKNLQKGNPEPAGFFGLNDTMTLKPQNAIIAAVHESQILVSGSVVKLRLLQDISLQGQMIPAGQFVFGTAQLNNERLIIDIASIRYGNSLYPVKLQVYDMDGLNGIYIPGAISRDVAKQSADNTIQSIELMTMSPSLPAQAATAGVNAAKSLLTKKIKLVKVMVKAGYQVLLKEKE